MQVVLSARSPAPPTPDYHPSMGDLMTMAIQPRHTKLGLAGQHKNWTSLSKARATLAVESVVLRHLEGQIIALSLIDPEAVSSGS